MSNLAEICKKCLGVFVSTRYSMIDNKLEKTCAKCGYSWRVDPADVTQEVKS